MEIIVTIAYFFLVRMIFFDYKLLRFNLFWKFVVFGIYAGAALTEIIALGQSLWWNWITDARHNDCDNRQLLLNIVAKTPE